MKEYIVRVKEIHECVTSVEANSLDDALSLVESGEGVELEVIWHSTMPKNTWIIEDENGNILRD